MKSYQGIRQGLIEKVQIEFNRAYPFLKVEFGKTSRETGPNPAALQPETSPRPDTDEHVHDSARSLLEKDIHLSDQLKVSELENSLSHLFGTAAQVYRKSGNLWLETSMSRDWTLKQQNDHGRDIASEIL